MAAEALEVLVGLREVLAVGPVLLVQVGDGVEAETVHAEAEPEVDGAKDGSPHSGVAVVEVRLVGVEPMPVVRLRDRIPGPVRRLEVLEDYPGFLVAIGGVAPHVEVALAAAGGRDPCPLEPRVLVGGVIEDDLGDHLHVPPVSLLHEAAEVAERPVVRVDARVVGDVVAVVTKRRRVEGEQPEGGHPELVEVVELVGEAPEVASAVAVGVGEGAHVQFVDDGVLVPLGACRRDHDRLRGDGRAHPARSSTRRWAGTPAGSSLTKLRPVCHR